MIKTAVVILNWNGLKFLRMFLSDVIRHTADADTEICVADNGSTDGSPEWLATEFKNIRLIRLDKNHGFAEGYNLALEQINAHYFVLLNSDIEVTEGWLKPLVSFLDSNPDVASCQPKILSYNRKDHFGYAGAAGGFLDKYCYPLCRGRILSHVEKDTGQYNSQSDIFWSTGACMIVRREAWVRCGGFDPDFFAHMEEIDLCWRLQNEGYRITYIPQSKVYHVGGGSLPYDSPFKTYLNFRNSLFLLYKNLPQKNFRNKMFFRRLLDGLAALFFLSKGQFSSFGAVWKAHIDYYKHLPQLRSKRDNSRNKEIGKTKGILNKFVVFEFYIRRNRTFSSLKVNL